MGQVGTVGWALLLLVSTCLGAQGAPGWRVHVEGTLDAVDAGSLPGVTFAAVGDGFHALADRPIIVWHPSSAATGDYTLAARFTLMEPVDPAGYYGIFFAGRDLETPQREFASFAVAHDGTWLVAGRAGREDRARLGRPVRTDAVSRPDGVGKSTNTLEVRVRGGAIELVVNGIVVHSMSASELDGTDGLYGFAIDDRVEVVIDDLVVS